MTAPLSPAPPPGPPKGLSRRGFLGVVGAGVAGLSLGLFDGEVRLLAAAPADSAGFDPNAFIHVAADGSVTIVCARSELGQGVRSALPMLIADEMGADLARVRVVQGDGDAKYGDQNTDGSTSVRKRYDDLRTFGATARAYFVAAAAARWRVPTTECDARDHVVTHARSKRTLSFAELVADAARMPKPTSVPLKALADLPHVGRASPIVDGLDIVTGRARYGADVPPDVVGAGLLYAVVERPPDFMGALGSFDASAALAVPGVVDVIAMPAPPSHPGSHPAGGVAVVARDTWAALQGRAALKIDWVPGPHASYDSPTYREALLATVGAEGDIVRQIGDAGGVLSSAPSTVTAAYYVPQLAHVPMEPPSATARVTAERCEVWAATQNPQGAIADIAKALSLRPDQVVVHVTLVGGAFGRKSINDFAIEAAWLAQKVRAPVRVQWTRTDDIKHDFLHPASAQRFDAALDAADKVVAWRHRTAFAAIRSSFGDFDGPSIQDMGQGVLDLPLAVPNVRAESGHAVAHTRIGWMRSVCNIHHGFAIGSFIDELAQARKQDPRETWLELMGPAREVTALEAGVKEIPNYGQSLAQHPVDVGRHRHVVERVCELAGWPGRQTSGANAANGRAGRAFGLAAHRSFLTSVGVVAAVVARDGDPGFAVDEVWVVVDAGVVLNLDRVLAQMEGAVIFGMSIALHGEITAKDGVVAQTNFRDYRVVRIAEAPRAIHVEVVKSEHAPGGIGEPGVPPVAPAITNALAALTGRRFRELPVIRDGRLRT